VVKSLLTVLAIVEHSEALNDEASEEVPQDSEVPKHQLVAWRE